MPRQCLSEPVLFGTGDTFLYEIHTLIGDEKASTYVQKETNRIVKGLDIRTISNAEGFKKITDFQQDVHLMLCIDWKTDLDRQMGCLPSRIDDFPPDIKRKSIIVVFEPTVGTETMDAIVRGMSQNTTVNRYFNDVVVRTATYKYERKEAAAIPLYIFIIAACLKIHAVKFIFSRNK
ncbi:unnamed protein product [Mytilus edulis]|uniref:Uncharacterized protein n=1 Tax=Mytilus edulis TaxID=6550 RepID=A0A8S3REX0_MYTED|nr:unnamed protein product [Mytilus edulis]